MYHPHRPLPNSRWFSDQLRSGGLQNSPPIECSAGVCPCCCSKIGCLNRIEKLNFQISTKPESCFISTLQDTAAAAGLRALQRRINLVPVAVHEFLQAGGVSASVTILCSQPLHEDLRDAAVTLLQAVLQKLPCDASAAFL